MPRVFAAALLCGLSLAGARSSEACSRAGCDGHHFVPRGPVPASLTALRWRPSEDQSSRGPWLADEIVLEGTDGRSIAVSVESLGGEYLLTLQDRLRANTEYFIRAPELCRTGDARGVVATRFATTSARMLPDVLGQLELTPGIRNPVNLRVNSGLCANSFDAFVTTMSVVLTEDAEPWRTAFEWETLVDGEPWRLHPGFPHVLPFGESWRGAGRGAVFVLCGEARDLSGTRQLEEGRHTIVMQARLPGVDRVWSTNPTTVDLNCDPQMTTDGGAHDQGLNLNGGGLQLNEQGCACRESSASGTHLFLVGLLAFGLSRKQRRR